jgi:hypothetical protein
MKKGTKEALIDFETLGGDATNCVVLDCAVLIFDRERFTSDNPYTIANLKDVTRFKLSVQDQVTNYDYVVENRVIDFWSEQDKEVRAKIKPLPDDITVVQFVDQFLALISKEKIGWWWSRGNAFDPVILTRLFKSQDKVDNLNGFLKFWAVQDMRTFINAKFDFPPENGFSPYEDKVLWEQTFKQHDSSWDVLADLLRLQAIARAENDLEQLEL